MSVPEKPKKKFGCLKIIGILVLIFIILGVAAGFYIYKKMGKATNQMASSMVKIIEKEETKGTFSQDTMKVLTDIKDVLKGNERTNWAILLSSGVVYSSLQDNKLTEEEFKNLTAVRDLLVKSNGKISAAEMGKFYQEHPEVQKSLQDAKKK